MADVLKIVFPLLMVAGAVGSLVVNIIDHGEWATSLQWVGAGLLYTALTIRIYWVRKKPSERIRNED